MSKRSFPTRTTNLTIHDCQSRFHLPLEEAAKQLGVSRPTIARVMRAHGYPRWPFRLIRAKLRRYSNSGPCMQVCNPQLTLLQHHTSTGTTSTPLAISDAIQFVRSRREGAKYQSDRYSGKRASCSNFKNDSPVLTEYQQKDQDCGSDPVQEPTMNNEYEIKSSHVGTKTACATILDTVQEGYIDEHSMREEPKVDESSASTRASNATSMKGNIARSKVSLGIVKTFASIVRPCLPTKSTSGSDIKGRAANMKKAKEKKSLFRNQGKYENCSRNWRRCGRKSSHSKTIENVSYASVSNPESSCLESTSTSLHDFDGYPGAEIIMPGVAVPWMDISCEELEILGVPSPTEKRWNLE